MSGCNDYLRDKDILEHPEKYTREERLDCARRMIAMLDAIAVREDAKSLGTTDQSIYVKGFECGVCGVMHGHATNCPRNVGR